MNNLVCQCSYLKFKNPRQGTIVHSSEFRVVSYNKTMEKDLYTPTPEEEGRQDEIQEEGRRTHTEPKPVGEGAMVIPDIHPSHQYPEYTNEASEKGDTWG